jgi:hypothetical protein
MIDDMLKMAFVSVWALIACNVSLHYFVLIRIRYKFGKVWEELGKPGVFKNNNGATWEKVHSFIRQRKDSGLGDAPLTGAIAVICLAERMRFNLIVSGFLTLFVCYFAFSRKLLG